MQQPWFESRVRTSRWRTRCGSIRKFGRRCFNYCGRRAEMIKVNCVRKIELFASLCVRYVAFVSVNRVILEFGFA